MCHKEVLEAINSNLWCHNVTLLGFHHKENFFSFHKTNRRSNFQIYSGTKHVEFRTGINLEFRASVGFMEK